MIRNKEIERIDDRKSEERERKREPEFDAEVLC